MRRALLSLIRAAEERPRRTVAIAVACMLLGVASALTLRPGTAVEDMLPAASPSGEAMGRILRDFRLIDDLVLVVDPPPGEAAGPGFEGEVQAMAAAMAQRLEGDPQVGAIRTEARTGGAGGPTGSASDFLQRHGGRLLDAEGRATLREALEPAALAEALRSFRRSLDAAGTGVGAGPSAADPLGLLPRLLGDATPAPPATDATAGRPATIRVSATRPANDLPYAAGLVDAVTAAAEEANPPGSGSLRWTLTGAHAIADFTARSVRRDMVISLAVTMVSLSVLFLLVYRSGRTLPLLLATVNGGLVVAFGLYALLGGSLSPVTAVCGAVLAGLGIDYGVHLLAARRFHGATPPEALRGEAARAASPPTASATARVGPSLLAACVTSCIGFGAVGLAGVRALSEFAVLGVLGLLATLAMTVLFLPAALRLAGGEDAARPRLDPSPLLDRLLRRPRPALFATSIVGGMVAAVLALGGGVRFADDLEAMHARPNPPLEAQERLTGGGDDGPGHLLVLVTADPLRPGSLAVRTRAAEAALREAAAAEGSALAGVIGPGVFLPPPPPGAAEEPLPEPAAALARFGAAAEAAGLSPEGFAGFRETLAGLLAPSPAPTPAELAESPAGPLLPRSGAGGSASGGVASGGEAALVIVRLARAWELLPDRADTLARVRAAVAHVPGATATGLAVVGADMQARIAEVLPRLLALAGLAVVLWLALVFRQPWDVFVALGPAAFGLAAVFAAVALTGTELQAANLIALPLTLGLGVDDGIFLVRVARGVRRAQASPTAGVTPETLANAAAGPAHAVIVTSVTTIAAFGSLWFTRSPAIASLGLLSAVGVTACLLASMFGLLPALAIQQDWLLRRRREREQRRGTGSP